MKKNYFFDAILVSSTLPNADFMRDTMRADGGRIYSIRLFDDFEDLPIDRLFVEEFPPGPALARFTASPCELIGSLTTRGVCVGLTENNEQIAAGNFMLGPPILRQLTESAFSVTQNITVELFEGKNSKCVVELIVKISSSDPDINQILVPFGNYDVCRPAERDISKRDIIFTLGRSGKCGTSACITDERLMSHAGAPNPCPHAPTEGAEAKGGAASSCGCFVAGMEAPNAAEEAKEKERTALKQLIEELGLDKVKVPKPPRTFEKSRRWHTSTSSLTPNTTSTCHPNEFGPETAPRKRKALSLTASMEQQARRRILGPYPVAEPELKNEPYKPPHLCPLCKSDISWLPKISACPYCGYKTFEIIASSEDPYDMTTTAQQLLQDCLRKEVCERDSFAGMVDQNDKIGDGSDKLSQHDDPNIPNRCLCISGQPCARCRIRTLCENYVKNNEVKQPPLPQAQAGSKDHSQPVQGKEPKRKKSTTSQRHSQLVSIFTEMRNMYDPKNGTADKADDQAMCEAICHGTKTSKARRKARKELQKALKEIDKAYPSPPKKRVKKRVQRPKSKCYTFLKVHKRPSNPRIGHTDCISDGACSGYCKVPCHMGWMWTKSEMARYKSWRPGAIAKPIRQMMAYFLRDYPADNICLSRYHYRWRGKGSKEKPEEEPLVQHPMLQISRRGDEYIITLRPLKDPKSLSVSANPFADMKPVVFRITKDPMAVALRELREFLRDSGFAPCTCGRPLANCFCRTHIDKKRIQYEVDQQCSRRGLSFNSDTFTYSAESDGDDSDREYEFGVTPPVAVIKPERQPRPDRTNTETQYLEEDWASPSVYPHPASMLVQYDACVMAERKKKFNWLYGKGNVHAEPKKPIMKNKSTKPAKKKLPFRNAGGFDDPRRFDPPPLNRPWKKNATGR
ncbi:uncharacterized protein [Drosophila kikkawai]|uniref:Uncharacterized protein isoform X1 n=1 Tax=Drosophila kikkawai TaxID=30033 RepID=A0A6P4JT72_DROKI|nr:uncharacterized protein LOC108085919 [Drosophila kikkawai]